MYVFETNLYFGTTLSKMKILYHKMYHFASDKYQNMNMKININQCIWPKFESDIGQGGTETRDGKDSLEK